MNIWVRLGGALLLALFLSAGAAAAATPAAYLGCINMPPPDEGPAPDCAALTGVDPRALPDLEHPSLLSARLLESLYAESASPLLWSSGSRIGALLERAESSVAEGFDPEDFRASWLRPLVARGALDDLAPGPRAAADLLLTDTLLRYLHHHRYGKLDPRQVDRRWHDRPAPPAEALLEDLRTALAAADLQHHLSERFVRPFWYRQLKQALAGYARLESREALDALTLLPGGPTLTPGQRGKRVAQVRERLQALGYAPDPHAEATAFDPGLREAVIQFQREHGLVPDGLVGPRTIAALNQPFDPERVERIRINLERMRWLADDLPPDYLLVDVAGFRVRLIRDGQTAWSTRVVVGTPETQTPMFREDLDHLIFNPTWTVPVSIHKRMDRFEGFRLVDRQSGQRVGGGDPRNWRRYRLVQPPGPKNALGQVKFMFPNRHAIYLHDTPSKALFQRPARAQSNGCVRVQEPLKLAELLLEGSRWDAAAIGAAVAGERTRRVNLEPPMPVLLYYLTAWADEQGRVHFRPDVYDRDTRLREVLPRPVTQARIAFPPPPEPEVDSASDPAGMAPEDADSIAPPPWREDEADGDLAPVPDLDLIPQTIEAGREDEGPDPDTSAGGRV